jgi:choline dehydrogenase-like flavoprotein
VTTPTFDYIIVGAGSAGCALANRLSADTNTRVLLLEAGGSDANFYLRMPLGFLRALFDPRFIWNYNSEPEPTLNGRNIWLPRGRVMGGSSSINGMFYMRGHSQDFDGWAARGCTGWSYAEVLPYFRRMESSWRGADLWHGAQGPLPVNAIDTSRLLHEPLMASASAAGFAVTQDIHAELEEGFARGEATIDSRGRRASTSRAYLDPIRARRNLQVQSEALVQRVLLDHGRAIGVEYRCHGELRQALAAREVILCGGAYNSPQLLMLSGIGDAEQLAQHGIQTQVHLPGVGRNLSEHARVPVAFATSRPNSFLQELRADRVARSVIRWYLFGTGPFATQINSCNIVIRTSATLSQPDVQLMCNPVRMDAKIWWPLISQQQAHQLTADVVVLHPHSRGSLQLRSADPDAKPRIQLGLFSDARDFATARAGIRAARRIYATSPQAELIAGEITPGAAATNDAELDAYIRQNAGVTQHPVGTCAMGIDDTAVVDPELRVRGVQGLRVADASIMPTVPGGNTNAACIMIGEKASDLILGRRLAPEYARVEPTTI